MANSHTTFGAPSSFVLYNDDMSWSLWVSSMLFTILLVATITSIITKTAYQKNLDSEGWSATIPVVPYHVPFFGHLAGLVRSPYLFITSTLHTYGCKNPLNVKAGFLNFTIVANTEHVKKIFASSKTLTSQPSTIFALKHLFATPKHVISFYEADDSGMASVPRKKSRTAQQDRIHFHQARASQKFLAGEHMQHLASQYFGTLERNLEAVGLQEETWAEFPDLFAFLQDHVSRSAIESIMGSKILELNPDLIENFWTFDNNVPLFLRCIPRLFMPRAYRARDRILASIKKWHAYGNKHSDCSKIGPDDPEWEPYFGAKLIRARQNYMLKMKRMDADSIASEDLGLMFAINTNVLPSIFWYLFESLKDPSLHEAMMAEASASLPPGSAAASLDIVKFKSLPLMQSCYAEVLRLRLAIAMSRVSELDDFQLDSKLTIKRNHPLVIFSRPLALNDESWTLAGRPQSIPLEEFHAGRFLVSGKSNDDTGNGSTPQAPQPHPTRPLGPSQEARLQYSLDGLESCWVPYGGGQRKCPGRHFAKNEILGTFAILCTQYDIELLRNDLDSVKPDLRWFPMGALPPSSKVPFRIRKKASPVQG